MENKTDRIIQIMRDIYKTDISFFNEALLKKTIETKVNQDHNRGINAYEALLKADAREAAQLQTALNNTYTEFFRNELAFAYLKSSIIPELIRTMAPHSEIRIWSAGCSSGQEAYSIAIVMDELIAHSHKPVGYRIFATDQSVDILKIAQEGIYEIESIQNLKVNQLNKYFEPVGHLYRVVPHLKENISFSVHDLLDQSTQYPAECIYGDFDIVFCSNLLLYYRSEIQNRIIQKIQNGLKVNGFLITDESERAIVEKHINLQHLAAPLAIFQHKKHL